MDRTDQNTITPHCPLQTQAKRLHATRRTLAEIGTGIATAARMAAAVHMAEAAPNAQNPRDQASRLRDLVASMATTSEGVHP